MENEEVPDSKDSPQTSPTKAASLSKDKRLSTGGKAEEDLDRCNRLSMTGASSEWTNFASQTEAQSNEVTTRF